MSLDHLGLDGESASTPQISQSQPVGWYGGLLCNRSGRGATVVYISSRNSNRSLVNCVISDAQFSAIRRDFLTPAGGLPVLLWVFAAVGMLWPMCHGSIVLLDLEVFTNS